jgi:YebC/PmpR family DNA-binding regulatory protein
LKNSSVYAYTEDMSGHSKWSKIKRQKGATDAKKSKIFGKLAKRIGVESKLAKGDISSPALQFAIKHMPNDNIERAIKKGSSSEQKDLESITYEAYGPGGVAMLIEVLTENKNKAAQEIKHILSDHKLSLAGVGSVLWAFDRKEGEYIPKTTVLVHENDSDALRKLIEELEENDEVQEVWTNAE